MMDRKAFYTLSYGLYVVSALDKDGRKVGCVANTFEQVASTPPMVCVALNKENVTTQAILDTKEYTVSVLSTDADMELIGRFGFNSSYSIDKFDGVAFELSEDGVPYLLDRTVASFTVKVDQSLDVATHILFVGEVVASKVLSDATPLTYDYYHNVIKGKTPPKAASYQADDASAPADHAADGASTDASSDAAPIGGATKTAWRCTLCGYIVEMEELPDDFTCPICGAGKEFFEKIEIPA